MNETTATIDHRVTIFEKAGIYGSVGIWTNGNFHYVGSYDPRTSPSVFERMFPNKDLAEIAFNDHVRITVANGWRLVWSGPHRLATQHRFLGSLN